jgi:hypothetical protein
MDTKRIECFVRVTPDTKKKLKVLAAQKGLSMGELIEALLDIKEATK